MAARLKAWSPLGAAVVFAAGDVQISLVGVAGATSPFHEIVMMGREMVAREGTGLGEQWLWIRC